MAKRKRKPIRSDPATVERMLAMIKQREQTQRPRPPMRARTYRPGPHTPTANHPAQGGLPSLGKGA